MNWWWQREGWPHSSQADLEPWWLGLAIVVWVVLAVTLAYWTVA